MNRGERLQVAIEIHSSYFDKGTIESYTNNIIQNRYNRQNKIENIHLLSPFFLLFSKHSIDFNCRNVVQEQSRLNRNSDYEMDGRIEATVYIYFDPYSGGRE